jgi:hypothetical protein
MTMNNLLQMFDTVSSSEKGAWLHLTIPGSQEKAYTDGKKQKKPMRIMLKGPDSDEWTAFQRKAMKTQGGESKWLKSHEDTILEDSKLFAKMTIAFDNIPNADGGVLAFTFESAVKLYMNYKDIRIQALRFVMSQENFTQKPLED